MSPIYTICTFEYLETICNIESVIANWLIGNNNKEPGDQQQLEKSGDLNLRSYGTGKINIYSWKEMHKNHTNLEINMNLKGDLPHQRVVLCKQMTVIIG